MESVIRFIKENLAVTFSLKDSEGEIKTSRNLQHFLSLKPFQGAEKAFYDKTMSYAMTSEKISPGSGIVFLRKIVNQIDHENIFQSKDKLELYKKLDNLNLDKVIFNMLIQSLDLASINSTFLVKKSTNSFFSVELIEGYSFKVSPLFHFDDTLNMNDAKIICVDGYVENISEIHHILLKISENKDECLFFCRGMSDDVRHTLKVNFDRRTLQVIPYSVPFDLESCNTLVDIATVAGTDVVSSNKGQLISSINVDKFPKIERCVCSKNSVSIFSKKFEARVKNHLKALKEKREERLEIEEILSQRIKSLTSSCIEFRIPDDLNHFSRCQQLDEGIRLISFELSKKENPEIMIKNLVESYKRQNNDSIFIS